MRTPTWKTLLSLGVLVLMVGLKGPPHNPNRPHGCLFVGPDCQAVDQPIIERPAGGR